MATGGAPTSRRPTSTATLHARRAASRALVPEGETLPDLALRFILSSPDVSTVIPGMRKARHVEANMAASDRGPLPDATFSRPCAPTAGTATPNLTP